MDKANNMENNKPSNCAFTIVAKNYIGLAKVLEDSIKEKNPDVDFYIFVADEIPEDNSLDIPSNIIESKMTLFYTDDRWKDMTFKYNLTEFCTSIKPRCFQYLFKRNYKKAIYFDPDIYVFNSLLPIYKILEEYSICVTPHSLFPNSEDATDIPYLQSGPYNLGFLGLNNNEISSKLLNWWDARLIDNCFDELFEYTFTDQKWMLLIHSYFPQSEIYVSRNLGMNVAPWNFKERKIIENELGFSVEYRQDESIKDDLVFIHYSGYDYKALLAGEEIRPRVSKEDVDYNDIKIVMDFYVRALKEHENDMLKYITLPYSYATFNNGVRIEKFHRRLYHRLNHIDSKRFTDPFSVKKGSLYEVIKKKKLYQRKQEGQNIDGGNGGNTTRLLVLFNNLMKQVCRVIGYHRYLMLLRLLKHFSRYESQVFLLDKKYNGISLEIPEKQTM